MAEGGSEEIAKRVLVLGTNVAGEQRDQRKQCVVVCLFALLKFRKQYRRQIEAIYTYAARAGDIGATGAEMAATAVATAGMDGMVVKATSGKAARNRKRFLRLSSAAKASFASSSAFFSVPRAKEIKTCSSVACREYI